MRKFLIAAAIAAIFSQAGAESLYELPVGDFAKLVVEDGFNVDYRCHPDSTGYARFVTSEEIADKIVFENNRRGVLKILKGFHDDGQMVRGLPVITVYSRFIKEVKNCGDSTLRVIDPKPTMEIKAYVVGNGRVAMRNIDCSKFDGALKTGNGTLTVSGKCETASLNNTGTGSIQADNLQAANVSARFLGTGTTGCWATDELTVKGVMKGKLYFRDKPKRIRNYSAGVKIFSLDGEEWAGGGAPAKETPVAATPEAGTSAE